MKKLFAIAFVALALASCGNKSKGSQEAEQQEGATGATSATTQAYSEAKPSLDGEWQLVDYANGSSNVEIDGEYILTVDDGMFSMQTDCNSVSGEIMTKDNTLSVSHVNLTMMACEDESVQIAMTSLFNNANSFEIDGDSLTIKTPTDESAKFVRK